MKSADQMRERNNGMILVCKKRTEYLFRFGPDEPVAIVVADIEKCLTHKISGYMLLDEQPALLLEMSETGSYEVVGVGEL